MESDSLRFESMEQIVGATAAGLAEACAHAIEGAIKREYEKDHSIVDSSVMLALDRLAVKPEAVSNDFLAKAIQNSLRLLLSEIDYSRDEVKMAVRKILASVKRHKAAAGIRGYLDFIMEYIP